ncbi:hypothetical protein [Bradyrhizobium sp. USDA 3364]
MISTRTQRRAIGGALSIRCDDGARCVEAAIDGELDGVEPSFRFERSFSFVRREQADRPHK